MNRSNPFLKPVESQIRLDGTIERGGNAVHRVVRGERIILSRAICHFELIASPPGGVSKKALKAAELAARLRTPFPKPDLHLDVRNGMIGVWSWPQSAVADVKSADAVIIPETLTRPKAEGAVLTPCMDGNEGTIWRDGVIVASRWWAHEPSDRQWQQFLRSAPQSSEAEGSGMAAAASSVASSFASFTDSIQKLAFRDWLALAVVLLLAPTLFLSAQFLRNAVAIRQYEASLAEVQVASSEIIEARSRFAALANKMASYNAILGIAHPADTLATFAETAEGFSAELMSFRSDGESLEILLRADASLPLADLVTDLERDPGLSNVLLEPSNRPGDWRITASIGGN